MLEEIIKPETELERRIISDPEFIEGSKWGKPRRGHPEGEIILHIGEVLKNTEKWAAEYREDLRVIAIIHDTFKHKVDRDKPRSGENHHGMIARRFAEKYFNKNKLRDKRILEIIELHDEAYNSFNVGNRKGNWDKAEKRALDLADRLHDNDAYFMYVSFYECDNKTGDKGNEDFQWFIGLTNPIH